MRRENPIHARAKREAACATCGAAPGERCTNRNGGTAWPPHKARVDEFENRRLAREASNELRAAGYDWDAADERALAGWFEELDRAGAGGVEGACAESGAQAQPIEPRTVKTGQEVGLTAPAREIRELIAPRLGDSNQRSRLTGSNWCKRLAGPVIPPDWGRGR